MDNIKFTESKQNIIPENEFTSRKIPEKSFQRNI